jgi:antitoxin VapB
MITRVFKSGNSLAVRIPSELADGVVAGEMEIERHGDGLVVRPVSQRTLAGLLRKFAAFTPDFMAAGRESQLQKPRNWR